MSDGRGSADDASRQLRLEQILADYLHAEDEGQAPDQEQLVADHPDLADELASFFRNRSAMQHMAEKIQPYELPTLDVQSSDPFPAAGEMVRYFGDYELLEEIARGGMGVVYKARQISLNRIVAIKMILAGTLATAQDVQRFRAEAEAAANLDHPGIVPIYEIGEQEGKHYFSMAYIGGGSLSARISALKVDPKSAVELMIIVCRAVHFAHQRGILHRDLKPANILIDSAGHPHVSDFGLAKRVGADSGMTMSGAVVGTPCYMAPEQARAEKVVTTAADVYSLGAVLYELLTGQPPFKGSTPVETLRRVLDDEPALPRSLNSKLDRDLDTIVLKCLEKDLARRYQSADALADDLARWLKDEPILARPVGRIERTAKLVRRHPVVCSLLLALLVALVGGTIASSLFAVQAQRAAVQEKLARNEVETKRLAAEKLAADNAALAKSEQVANTQLRQLNTELVFDRGLTEIQRGNVVAGLFDFTDALEQSAVQFQDVIRINLSAWQNSIHRLNMGWQRPGTVTSVVLAPAGNRAAIIHMGADPSDPTDGECHLVNSSTYQDVAASLKHGGRVPDSAMQRVAKAMGKSLGSGRRINAAAFSPDGEILVTAGLDGFVRRWNARTGEPIGQPLNHADAKNARANPSVNAVAFLPGGASFLAATSHGRVVRWDSATGEQVGEPLVLMREPTIIGPGGKPPTKPSVLSKLKTPHILDYLVVSPDRKLVLVGSNNRIAWVLNVETLQPQGEPFRTAGLISCIAFSPDSKNVLIGVGGGEGYSNRGEVRIFDAQSGEPAAALILRPARVTAIDVRPRDAKLVIAAADGSIVLWDLTEGKLTGIQFSHQSSVSRALFIPDSDLVISADSHGTAHVWDSNSGLVVGGELTHGANIHALAITQSGQQLWSGASDGSVCVWQLAWGHRPTVEWKVNGFAREAQFASDGKSVQIDWIGKAPEPSGFNRWELLTAASVGPGMPAETKSRLVPSPNGRLAVSWPEAKADANPQVRLWDVSANTSHQLDLPAPDKPKDTDLTKIRSVFHAAFSPDSRYLLIGALPVLSPQGLLWLYDTQSSSFVGAPTPFVFAINPRAVDAGVPLPRHYFDSNSRLMLWTDLEGTTVWDLSAFSKMGTLKSNSFVQSAAFNPSGDRIAVADKSGRISLLSIDSLRQGNATPNVMSHQKAANVIAFSPDSQLLASASDDRTVRFWDVNTSLPVGRTLVHSEPVERLVFDPQGRTLLTACGREIHLWDVCTQRQLGPTLSHPTMLGLLFQFTPDGDSFITSGGDLMVRMWACPKPANHSAAAARKLVELYCGVSRRPDGSVRPLDRADWLERRNEFNAQVEAPKK